MILYAGTLLIHLLFLCIPPPTHKGKLYKKIIKVIASYLAQDDSLCYPAYQQDNKFTADFPHSAVLIRPAGFPSFTLQAFSFLKYVIDWPEEP